MLITTLNCTANRNTFLWRNKVDERALLKNTGNLFGKRSMEKL